MPIILVIISKKMILNVTNLHSLKTFYSNFRVIYAILFVYSCLNNLKGALPTYFFSHLYAKFNNTYSFLHGICDSYLGAIEF